MKEGEILSVKVYRFDPSRNKTPRYDAYSVPYQKQMRVLDVLNYISDILGSGVGYRYFCGIKRCGLCAVKVNGKPLLACWEPAVNEMTIEPLPNFPVVKDLVIDRSAVDQRMLQIHPTLERVSPYTSFPEKITHPEIEDAYNLMSCIDCLVCTASCPVMAERERFAGPYIFVQLAKLALDPRDGGIDRNSIALAMGIEGCDSCGACEEACPMGIPVLTGAIDRLRDRLVESDTYYIRGWRTIRKMPLWLRNLLKCKLKLTLGEGLRKRS